MKSKNKFFLCGVLSYVLWGFLPILFKTVKDFDNVAVIFYRILFSAFFLIAFFVVTKTKSFGVLKALYQKSRKQFFQMFFFNAIGSMLLIANWLTYIYVVNKINVHTAAVGYLILPITTSILALIILKERLSLLQCVAIALSGFSCYLMSNVNIHEVFYILVIALSYSFYLITQRKNIHTSRVLNLAMQMIIGSVIMFFVIPQSTVALNFGASFWILIPFIALFFTVAPLLLNMIALNGMTTSSLSFLGYINPIMGFLIGIFLYQEQINGVTAIAYALLALALCMFNWNWIRKLYRGF